MGSTGLIQTRTASYNGRDDKSHIFPGRFLGPQYNGRPGHWQRSWEGKKTKTETRAGGNTKKEQTCERIHE